MSLDKSHPFDLPCDVRTGHYVLGGEDGHEPRLFTGSLLEWATWYESAAQRQVAFDELPGGYRVSTVFLALDHGYGFLGLSPVQWSKTARGVDGSFLMPEGSEGAGERYRPLVFETMVFGPPTRYEDALRRYVDSALEQERCSTWAEALEIHARILRQYREIAGKSEG